MCRQYMPAAALALLGVLGLTTAPSATCWAAAEARITAVKLQVSHRSGAAGAWQTSRMGTTLPGESRVRTGKRSAAQTSFADGCKVRIGPRSDLVITDPATKRGKVVAGEVFANIVSGTGAQITGTTATAAIKGTWVLFQAPTEEAEGRLRNYDALRVWGGEAEFGTDADMVPVGDMQTSSVAPGEGPTEVIPGPPSLFGSGTLYPWWFSLLEDSEVSATPGTSAGAEFKEENYDAREGLMTFAASEPGPPGPTDGGLDIVVRSVPALASGPSPALLSAGLAMAASAAADQMLGKSIWASPGRLDIGALVRSGGQHAWGRARVAGVHRSLYGEASVLAYTESEGDTRVSVCDLFVPNRWQTEECIIDAARGRQRYLDSPVNNSTLGSLFGAIRYDGVSIKRQGAGYTAYLG